MPHSSASGRPQGAREGLKAVVDEARELFAQKHAAREAALRLSRETVQHSANSIRAIHRGEFQEARQLLSKVTHFLKQIEGATQQHRDVYYAGFVEDAQKEYAEASVTLALVEGSPLPRLADLGVGPAPYLNGLGEAVGELRRYILDGLRRNDTSRCEELLDIMDETYTALVTVDFPDAMTRGLRRTTDMVRGVLERTRGDLTMALRQQSLEARLSAFEGRIRKGDSAHPQAEEP